MGVLATRVQVGILSVLFGLDKWNKSLVYNWNQRGTDA